MRYKGRLSLLLTPFYFPFPCFLGMITRITKWISTDVKTVLTCQIMLEGNLLWQQILQKNRLSISLNLRSVWTNSSSMWWLVAALRVWEHHISWICLFDSRGNVLRETWKTRLSSQIQRRVIMIMRGSSHYSREHTKKISKP